MLAETTAKVDRCVSTVKPEQTINVDATGLEAALNRLLAVFFWAIVQPGANSNRLRKRV